MLNLTYTLTNDLRKTLSVLEPLRKDILLTPLSSTALLGLGWDTTLLRVYGSFHLAHDDITKSDVASILTSHPSRFGNPLAREITNYRKTMATIAFDWLANDSEIAAKDILTIWLMLHEGMHTKPSSRVTDALKKSLKELLLYVNSSHEHPILTAGTIYATLSSLPEAPSDHGKLARLATYMFFYKFSYDMRGFLVIEDPLMENSKQAQSILDDMAQTGNLTRWLGFFAQATFEATEAVLNRIAAAKGKQETSPLWDLTDRQKEILILVEEPGSTMSNKKVQRRWNVSQITASRDLSKLVTLGLLYSHGKGRSIYYTKI